MGVYIPNMKMPHNCIECPRLEWYTDEDGFDRSYCQERVLYPSTIDRPTDCSLIEIVECKDCKWFINEGSVTICDTHEQYIEPTDFCSYGERRADEQKKTTAIERRLAREKEHFEAVAKSLEESR